MMLLCDALNLKPKNLTQQTLQTIMSLGDIYEVEITIARDSSKWKKYSHQLIADLISS